MNIAAILEWLKSEVSGTVNDPPAEDESAEYMAGRRECLEEILETHFNLRVRFVPSFYDATKPH